MTVAEQSTITRYITNGTTATFAAGFVVADASEISVYIDDIAQSTTTWSYASGNVVFVTIPPNGSVVSIQRVTPLERETSYANNTNQFLPNVLDADLDRIWLALQDIKTNLSRTLALPISDQSNPFTVLADLRTWLETAKNLADDTALPRLAEIETALDNLSARLTQVEFEVPATAQALQTQVDTLVLALSQVGGGAKAYQTLALLNASGAPTNPNLLAYVTNDTTPANNGLYSYNGTAWVKSLYDPLTQAIAAVNAEAAVRAAADVVLQAAIDALLPNAGIKFEVRHDLDGRHFLFAVVHEASDKLLFGIDSNLGVFLAGFNIEPTAEDFTLQDKAGREFLAIKNGTLSVFGVDITPTITTDGLALNDSAGREFLSFKNGVLSILNAAVSFGSSGINITDAAGRAIIYITPDGKVYIPNLVGNSTESTANTDLVYKVASLTLGQHKITDIIHILLYGQSLSRSTAQAEPAISTSQPFNNLMLAGGVRERVGDGGFDDSSFEPLVEASIETPVSGLLNGLAARFNTEFGTPPAFLGSTTGNGGRSALQLSPAEFGGTGAWFENTVEYVRRCKALADSTTQSYSVWAYDWIQGENDDDTPSYLYIQRVKLIKQELDKRILEITGQDFLPIMCMYQTAAHRHSEYASNDMRVALAQWRMSRNYPDIVMAAPAYMLPTSTEDYLHLTNESAWLMGQYHARALYQTLFGHTKWEPLQPIAVEWSGAQIDVTYNNTSQLVIDNALCATTTNAGFDIWESGTVNTSRISSVAVVGFDTVRITLNATAAANAVLTCGRGRLGDPAHSGSVSGARTNVRDSAGLYDTVTSPLSNVFALHNASVMWQYSRRDGFNAV